MRVFATLVWYLDRALKKFIADRCPLLASALVHSTLFSIFPLVLGLLSLSLFILGSSEGIIEKITPVFRQVFPTGIDEIVRNISVIKHTSITIALLGIIGFLWGASRIFRTLESTLNVIWKVKRDRPFLKKNLLALTSAFLVFIVLIASVGLTIISKAIGVEGIADTFIKSSVVFSIALFGLIYWLFPNRKVTLKAAYGGAVFTGLLWEAAKYVFSVYITSVADYSKMFGSLSAFIVLFLWIYYSAYIFLFGAEISYVIARKKYLARRPRKD
jgi:membrane protein